MVRQRRLLLPGQAHLIVLPTLPDLPAFRDALDQQVFLTTLRETARAEQVQIHAYALLPGEVRLLATVAQVERLSRWVQAIGRRYVSAYNRRHGRAGTLWSGRFRCAVVEPGTPRLTALQYVDGPHGDESLSSASHRCGGPRDPMLIDPPEYWSLGNTPFERESRYQRRLEAGAEPELSERLRRATIGGWPIGSVAFVDSLSASALRAVRPKARGRPRKTS